jgi:hypothetical protein
VRGRFIGVPVVTLIEHSPPHSRQDHAAHGFNDRQRYAKELQKVAAGKQGTDEEQGGVQRNSASELFTGP